MRAYYNEIDPYAAQWIRNLIKAGHVTDGEVDERSIADVFPSDLRGFNRCHFFAGVAVWDYALGLAGWGDDPVWTGSCPCQPFSTAGKGGGFDDERHLWPAFHHLISQCRPATVLGEQVASGPAGAWIDLVCSDMEGLDYSCGALAFPAASVGAPNLRDRSYWVADADLSGKYALLRTEENNSAEDIRRGPVVRSVVRMAEGNEGKSDRVRESACSSYWETSSWLQGRDGKKRPIEPGTLPLAYGTAENVGRVRAYGNAINAEQAAAFIGAVMDARP